MKLTGYKQIKQISSSALWSHWEAIDAVLGLRVWLLVFKVSPNDENLALRAILKETMTLDHPNILIPLDAKQIENNFVIIFPVFAGESLRSLIQRGVPIVERRATAVVKQVAVALQFARIRGVAHGLLLPELVFLSNTSDEVKVLGFGLGRFLRAITGRADSGEQEAGCTEIDDAFALGALAYQMLIGKLVPDLSPDKTSLLPPPKEINPKLSQSLSDLVCSLIQPDEHQRVPISRVVDLLLPQSQEEESEQVPRKGFAAIISGRLEQMKKSLQMLSGRGRWMIAVTVFSLAMVTILSFIIMRYASVGIKSANREEYYKFIQEAGDTALVPPEKEERTPPIVMEPSPAAYRKADVLPPAKSTENNSAVFTFMRPAFADRLQIDDGELHALPATVEIAFGRRRLAYYDAEFGLVWEMMKTFDSQTDRTVSVSTTEIGTGELAVVLNEAEKFGYVYVTIDGATQMTTPCRVQLSAGRHHVRIYRQNMTVAPAETVILITPLKKATVPVTILQGTGR